MPTRLNYTNRKKLNSDEVGLQIHPDEHGPATFEATLNLDRLRPDADDARVFVEAYRESTRMRFDFGSVAARTPPPPAERRLTEFDDWQRVLFRVKVTDMTDEPGKLLAWRNQIRPKGPDDHPRNDLFLFTSADLDGRVWDIEFTEDGALIQIDQQAGDCHEVGGDPKFQAAVYPEMMRRTLIHAFIEQQEDGDDPEHWSHAWLESFLKPQLGMDDPPPLDDDPQKRREWIDHAVRVFARRQDLNRLWNPEVREAE